MTFTTSTLAKCLLRSMSMPRSGSQSKNSFTTWYVRSRCCVPPTALPHGTHRSCHVLLQVWLAVVDTAAAFNAAGTAVVSEVVADHPFRVAYFPARERLRNCSVLERPTHGTEVLYRLLHLHSDLDERMRARRINMPRRVHFTVRRPRMMSWQARQRLEDLGEALTRTGVAATVISLALEKALAIYDYFHPYPYNSSAGTTTALRPTAIAAFCLSPLSLLFLWQLRRRRRPRHHIYLTRPWCGTARSS